MDHEGWVSIHTIASFNRVRTLTGGLTAEAATPLVKEVSQMSSLIEVDVENDKVRLTEGKWRDFLLPPEVIVGDSPSQTVLPSINTGAVTLPDVQGDIEGEDTDDDIEFVMGRSVGSPARHDQLIPSFIGGS